MDTHDFVSVNSVMSDILIHCNDETLRNYGLSKGFYLSGVQKALEELAIDTYYDLKTIDIPMDKQKLAVIMPDNLFNIRELYGFVGDCCDSKNSTVIHWKRLYNNKGKGANHSAARKEMGNRDPFYPKDGHMPSDLYYANSQNGMIMFSSNCCKFDTIRIVANTMGVKVGDEPVIPRMFRQAITDYVVDKTMSVLAVRDRSFRTLSADAKARLSESWYKAERRAKTLDTWKKSEMREYLGRINY
jgi:hypothetical protein